LTAAGGRRATKTDRRGASTAVHEATLMLAYLSREAGRRKTEPRTATVSPQRRKQLLARAQKTAGDIKARQ
jgi:hypothetical protein